LAYKLNVRVFNSHVPHVQEHLQFKSEPTKYNSAVTGFLLLNAYKGSCVALVSCHRDGPSKFDAMLHAIPSIQERSFN